VFTLIAIAYFYSVSADKLGVSEAENRKNKILHGKSSKGSYLEWTRDWFSEYHQKDALKRKSILEHCEEKLRQIRHATRDHPTPNPLRTAVSCDMFDKLCATLDADRKRLFTMLKEEVLISVFGPDTSEAKNVDFFKSVPFFSLVAGVKTQNDDLSQQIATIQKELDQKIQELVDSSGAASVAQEQAVRENNVLLKRLDDQQRAFVEQNHKLYVAERDLAKALEDLEASRLNMEDEQAIGQKTRKQCAIQLGIAHRMVADCAPREEVLLLKTKLKEKEVLINKLQAELKADRDALTPRPTFFRASEYVELKCNDLPRKSKDVVDDICEKLEFTTKRLDRLEQRLDRPFVQLDVQHVDWFALEPVHCRKCVEILFCSYCRPGKHKKTPLWSFDDRRAKMLHACRMTTRKFESFLVEFDVTKNLTLQSCRQLFQTSGSGKPVTELCFVEFSNCFVRLAIKLLTDKHNTHEDIRGLLRRFTRQLGFDDVEAFYARLIALEHQRAEEPPELNVTEVMNKLKGIAGAGEAFAFSGDRDQAVLTAEEEMLQIFRAQHLQIMEEAALGYYRSPEYASWLKAHPSPRVGLSMGTVYYRKEIKGGKWSENPRNCIFDPPPAETPTRVNPFGAPGTHLDHFDLRFGEGPPADGEASWRQMQKVKEQEIQEKMLDVVKSMEAAKEAAKEDNKFNLRD
jgi:hypothetical protein